MAHEHQIYDTNKRFVIDPNTRVVAITGSSKPVLVQYDHNSEHITFEITRFVEGHDLSLCDKVEVHYNNIAYGSRYSSKGVYQAEDLRIDPASNDKVTFTWVVSERATQYAGLLHFTVSFVCTNDGDLVYKWNSVINSDISISNGIDNGEAVVEHYADVLEMWKLDLFGIGDTEEARIKAASQIQKEQIELKGSQVLASIPDEYAKLQSDIDVLLEDYYIPQTIMSDNVITETFDDGRTRVTIVNGQTLTESYYSSDGTLLKSKTVVISQNGVTETLTTV